MISLRTGARGKLLLAESGKPLPAVLIVHGWGSRPLKEGGSYERIATVLNAIGYHAFLLEMRGVGANEIHQDTVTRGQNQEDILAAWNYLRTLAEVDPSHLAACGTSYGAYLLAASAPLLSDLELLGFRAPALYPDAGWEQPMKKAAENPLRRQWRSVIREVIESAALEGISRFDGRLFMVESEFDEDMPQKVGDSYERAAKNARMFSRHIIAGARHTLRSEEHMVKFLGLLAKEFKVNYPASS